MGVGNALNIQQPGMVSFDGVSVFNGRTLTAGAGISIANGDGIAGNPVITNTASAYISLSPYIVGNDANSGFATITAAIAQAVTDGASSTNPKNIYIKPKTGGYTENLTLSDGINLIGFGSSSFGGVATTQITGKAIMTTAGTASINNLVLTTNSDYVLELTGSNAVNVILDNCYINASNANAIHITNGSGGITLQKCFGNCSTNTFFIATAGAINVYFCVLISSGTTTNSTFANANLVIEYTLISTPITTSGTGSIGMFKCQILTNNTTALTHGGSGSSLIQETRIESGSASAVSIGATLPMMHCSVFSTNTNAITGAGTLQYAFIAFYGSSSSSGVNTSTQTALATLI
jgi:hypothetical protein